MYSTLPQWVRYDYAGRQPDWASGPVAGGRASSENQPRCRRTGQAQPPRVPVGRKWGDCTAKGAVGRRLVQMYIWHSAAGGTAPPKAPGRPGRRCGVRRRWGARVTAARGISCQTSRGAGAASRMSAAARDGRMCARCLEGWPQRNRRLLRRLAHAPDAVAGRPVAWPLPLESPSRAGAARRALRRRDRARTLPRAAFGSEACRRSWHAGRSRATRVSARAAAVRTCAGRKAAAAPRPAASAARAPVRDVPHGPNRARSAAQCSQCRTVHAVPHGLGCAKRGRSVGAVEGSQASSVGPCRVGRQAPPHASHRWPVSGPCWCGRAGHGHTV